MRLRGREFQRFGAATEEARSPYVLSFVHGIYRSSCADEIFPGCYGDTVAVMIFVMIGNIPENHNNDPLHLQMSLPP